MTPTGVREAAGIACWALVAGCWVGQGFLPWAGRGVLAGVSPFGAAGLVRRLEDGAVPGWTAYVVLALPLLGCLALALAAVRGAGAGLLRGLCWLLGSAVVVVVATGVVRVSPGGGLAVGAWIAAAGALLGLVAISLGPPGRSAGHYAGADPSRPR